MDKRLRREPRLLKAYSAFLTMVLLVAVLAGFGSSRKKANFEEINVERINVVENR